MSRIGKKPIKIDEGVVVKVEDDKIEVAGVQGKLKKRLPKGLRVELKEGKIYLSRTGEEWLLKSQHGLWRSLVTNMIQGVREGFSRDLKLVGTGYRVRMEGARLIIACGFSCPVEIQSLPGVKLSLVDNETIRVWGMDKELVGQMAAKIRAMRPPEPYKGKGIRYDKEIVRRKAGKTGAASVGKGAA